MRFLAILFVFLLQVVSLANHPAVCRVTFAGSGGSGTLVSVSDDDKGDAVVLTAWHVLASGARGGYKNPSLTFNTGTQIRRVTAKDIRQGPGDSAAIIVDAWKVKGIPPMRVWPQSVFLGMPVWAEGYGGGAFGRRKGRVTGRNGNIFTTSLPSIPGDSGGSLYTVDTQDVPYLVGIVSTSDYYSITNGPRARPICALLRGVGVYVTNVGRAVCTPRQPRITLQGRGWAAPYSQPNT